MKKFWKQLGKAICYFLLYFGVQNILGIVYVVAYSFKESFEAAASGGTPDVEAIALGSMDYLLKNQNNLINISGVITIAFLVLFFLIRKKNLLTEARVVKTKGKYIFLGMGLGLSCMLTINFGMSLLPESWLEAYATRSNLLLEGSDLAIIVSTVIMAPLVEELIFRGLMLSRLRKGMSDWMAILLSALIFGLAHGQILWMVYTFVLGVVFGLVAVKSESILPTLALHMVFNLCGVILPALLGEAISGGLCIAMLIVGVLVTAALLVVLLKKNKVENDTVQAV